MDIKIVKKKRVHYALVKEQGGEEKRYNIDNNGEVQFGTEIKRLNMWHSSNWNNGIEVLRKEADKRIGEIDEELEKLIRQRKGVERLLGHCEVVNERIMGELKNED